MIPVDLVVSAPMAAALGFAYGMGPCLISCAPFLGPVFLASDGGIKKSWKLILPLSLGRLTAYGAFGLVVGAAGHYVKGAITADSVRLVVGCAVLMMGLALLLRKTEKVCTTAAVHPISFSPDNSLGRKPSVGASLLANSKYNFASKLAPTRTLLPGGLYLMGIGMALSPCAPLNVVLFSAGMSGSAAGGLWLGLSFGLGAIVVPAIVYGVGMAYLGTQLREQLQSWRPKIERLSALLLVAVGISNLARW
ncbi:MAG: sulfite exporter TauE/SafE family protein [Sideroxydans sp.]|nr:sulfite exporter TauE/SafE family protein [Sideroxydans sp.]